MAASMARAPSTCHLEGDGCQRYGTNLCTAPSHTLPTFATTTNVVTQLSTLGRRQFRSRSVMLLLCRLRMLLSIFLRNEPPSTSITVIRWTFLTCHYHFSLYPKWARFIDLASNQVVNNCNTLLRLRGNQGAKAAKRQRYEKPGQVTCTYLGSSVS